MSNFIPTPAYFREGEVQALQSIYGELMKSVYQNLHAKKLRFVVRMALKPSIFRFQFLTKAEMRAYIENHAKTVALRKHGWEVCANRIRFGQNGRNYVMRVSMQLKPIDIKYNL